MAYKQRWIVVLNYFLIIIFVLAAVLQFNDTDAALWIMTYGAAALFCIIWRWGSISHVWYIALGSACLVWGISLLFMYGDQLSWNGMFDSIQMQNNSIEIIREAGGLFIIAVWMGILSYASSVRQTVD
jgi:hypothetical protein